MCKKSVQYFRGTPRHRAGEKIMCMSCARRGILLRNQHHRQPTSYIPENIFWINFYAIWEEEKARRKKSCSQGEEEGEKIVQFLYFSAQLRYVPIALEIFYEKEVVLRAYVYSSGFHKPKKITGAHTPTTTWMGAKARRKVLRLQFFITMKFIPALCGAIASCDRDINIVIASAIWPRNDGFYDDCAALN